MARDASFGGGGQFVSTRPVNGALPPNINTNFVKTIPQTALKKDVKAGWLPSSVLKNKHYFEKHVIHEGADIFFVGLFTPFYGSQQNIPICRFGRLAMVTDEKIPFMADSGEIIPQDL